MLRFAFVVFLAGCCLAADLDLKDHWGKFKSTFRKNFQSKSQETLKQAQWETAVKSILKHNVEADLGEHSYKKGVNEFTDMPHEEFKAKMLGLKVPANITRNYPPPNMKVSERALPVNFDWRSRNVVTSVKNQGSCGSCWTFAVSGAMEGLVGNRFGRLVDLSQQQLLDCSGSYGTQGCGGGWPNDAFKYIKDYGIETAQCYPYQNQQYQCSYNSNCMQTKITAYYDVPQDENTMKQYLYDYGPISVCIYVNNNMQAYSGGIFRDNNCNGYVNHAVLLVGYGTENGVDYWTIKNSWGPGWGEKGYIRMVRNANNMCNILNAASFPYL